MICLLINDLLKCANENLDIYGTISIIISIVNIVVMYIVGTPIVKGIKNLESFTSRKDDLQSYERKVSTYLKDELKKISEEFNLEYIEVYKISINYNKPVDIGEQMSYEATDIRIEAVRKHLNNIK